jgi:hypothetical protein
MVIYRFSQTSPHKYPASRAEIYTVKYVLQHNTGKVREDPMPQNHCETFRLKSLMDKVKATAMVTL